MVKGCQVAVFLSIVGGKKYSLLHNMLSPEKLSKKSLEDLFATTTDTNLQGLSHVICYTDDMLVTVDSGEEHLHNVEEVFKQLQHHQ